MKFIMSFRWLAFLGLALFAVGCAHQSTTATSARVGSDDGRLPLAQPAVGWTAVLASDTP